jgi:hypothetical protein
MVRGADYSGFDLHPDGRRVAVVRAPEAGANPAVNKATFLFNFSDELRRKVPIGKN